MYLLIPLVESLFYFHHCSFLLAFVATVTIASLQRGLTFSWLVENIDFFPNKKLPFVPHLLLQQAFLSRLGNHPLFPAKSWTSYLWLHLCKLLPLSLHPFCHSSSSLKAFICPLTPVSPFKTSTPPHSLVSPSSHQSSHSSSSLKAFSPPLTLVPPSKPHPSSHSSLHQAHASPLTPTSLRRSSTPETMAGPEAWAKWIRLSLTSLDGPNHIKVRNSVLPSPYFRFQCYHLPVLGSRVTKLPRLNCLFRKAPPVHFSVIVCFFSQVSIFPCPLSQFLKYLTTSCSPFQNLA